MNTTNIFGRLRWSLMVLVVLVLQVGCTGKGLLAQRTPVPASNIYCISMSTDAEFRANLKTSSAMYGSRRLGGLGGGSVCDLVEFEKYTVSWQTKDGRNERFEFDFEKIMRKFQDETPQVHTLTRHSSQPKLVVEYQSKQIEIYYRVSQYQLGGVEMRNGFEVLTKPVVISKCPLLTVPLTPPAETPVSK